MFSFFIRILKDNKFSLIAFCIASFLFLWMYIAFYPAIQDQSINFQDMLKSFPEGFMKAFNIDSMNFFGSLEAYISTEEYSFIWPILATAMTASVAGNAIAGEIEKGTIEIILSIPISRTKIFLTKYFYGLFSIVLLIAASVLATIPLAEAYNIDYQAKNFYILAGFAALFAASIFSLTMMFSAFFSEKGKVYFCIGSILIVMYVLNIVSGLKDNLDKLKYFTFFHYFNAADILTGQAIENTAYWVFGGCIILTTLFGAIWFNKRDIAV